MPKLSHCIKTTASVSFAAYLLLVRPSNTQAVTSPIFSNCPAPGGVQLVNYETGVHGIVGDTRKFTGSDQVFRTSPSQVVQCFCPDNGEAGIQTNWWKYESLNSSELEIMAKQGWVWIPNGEQWGLEPVGYLAKNRSFDCNGGIGGSDFSSGSVLGASTLAGTGSTQDFLGLLCLSMAFSFSANLVGRKARG